MVRIDTNNKNCFVESKIYIVRIGQTSPYNEDGSIWDECSLNSELEEEKIEFNEKGKPFVISLCKVEGESSDENQEDDHSTGSSFKCYKHRSKPKTRNYEEQLPRGKNCYTAR